MFGIRSAWEGCGGQDWEPGCSSSELRYDAEDDVWQGALEFPMGFYEYKVSLNHSFFENYGKNATLYGDPIPLEFFNGQPSVKFYYDDATHWVTDNVSGTLAVAVGSFQRFLGCVNGDWPVDCLRSWLKGPDGDGISTFATTKIPAGMWEVKVAINESWSENYGADEVVFAYDRSTHVLSVTVR